MRTAGKAIAQLADDTALRYINKPSDEAMKEYPAEQDAFWAGQFGDDYIERNRVHLGPRIRLFSRGLRHCRDIGSILELGAGIGMNLDALRVLMPEADIRGVEINAKAYAELEGKFPKSVNASALEFDTEYTFDLVFTKGFLIHVAPENIRAVYEKIARFSRRYVFIHELYNDLSVTVRYRNHDDKLFKRDFAGELIEEFGLRLVDYGFVYHLDPNIPRNEGNWFLLEK